MPKRGGRSAEARERRESKGAERRQGPASGKEGSAAGSSAPTKRAREEAPKEPATGNTVPAQQSRPQEEPQAKREKVEELKRRIASAEFEVSFYKRLYERQFQ